MVRGAEEIHDDVVENVAPKTGNSVVGRQGSQRVQSDDSSYVVMRGPDFHAYIRQVEEAARAGERIPDPPVQGESFEGLHRVTQVPTIPVCAAEITPVTEEHKRSEKRQRTGETCAICEIDSSERGQIRSSAPASAQVAATGRRCYNCGELGHK